MRAINGELFLSHSVPALIGNRDCSYLQRTFFIPVLVIEIGTLLDDRFQVLVDIVDTTRCVHPTGAVIEALIDEELTPGDRAVRIQTFRAEHLRFGPEI